MSDKLTELMKWLETKRDESYAYESCLAKAKELQPEPDQVKWAVVNKYWVYDTKMDAEEATEKYLPVCEAKDSIIVKIIEP
jgi:hypothetical protein